MPRSASGTGTIWYGEALPESDGSIVVTEWIAFFFVPIVPIGSRRVLWDANHENNFKPWYSKELNTEYYKVRKVPLYWPHVYKGYAATAVVFIIIFLLDYFNI